MNQSQVLIKKISKKTNMVPKNHKSIKLSRFSYPKTVKSEKRSIKINKTPQKRKV